MREANAGVGGMKGCPSRGSAALTTTSFAETLTMARFMICDQGADAFARSPTKAVFQAYVREHFWNERPGSGGVGVRHRVLLRAEQYRVRQAVLR